MCKYKLGLGFMFKNYIMYPITQIYYSFQGTERFFIKKHTKQFKCFSNIYTQSFFQLDRL